MARASRLTPAIRAGIIERVKAGAHPPVAARSLGISESTFYGWMERAHADRGEDPDLLNMSITDLRKLAKHHELPIPRHPTRESLAELLRSEGICSWDDYRQFAEEIDSAEADGELRNVVSIQRDLDGKPEARLKFMERRYKARWAPVTAIEVTGKDGGPIVTREERVERLASWLESVVDGEPMPEVAAGARVVEVESKALGE